MKERCLLIYDTFLKTLKECLASVKKTLKNETDKLLMLVEMLVMFCIIMNSRALTRKEVLLICMVFIIVSRFIKCFIMNLQNKTVEGMPIPRERMTRKTINGFIEYDNEADQLQMMQYIYELENYLQGRGWL